MESLEVESDRSWVSQVQSCSFKNSANVRSVWMVHCHILQHMVMGMQTVWVMGNASEITHGRSPDLVAGYLTYGGDAYGNETYGPLVTHYYDD